MSLIATMSSPKWSLSGSWRKLDIYLVASWDVKLKNATPFPLATSSQNEFVSRSLSKDYNLGTRNFNLSPGTSKLYDMSIKFSLRKFAWKLVRGKRYSATAKATIYSAPVGAPFLRRSQTVSKEITIKK